MRRKIFKNVSFLVSVSVILAFLLIELVTYNQFFDEMKETVRDEAQYVQISVNQMGGSYLTREVANVTATRITLIDENGEVTYDSAKKTEEMENHGDRPEVQDALETGRGEITRMSNTLGEVTYYYAIRLENGQVLRMAHTVDSVFKTMMSGFTLIVLIIVGVIVLNIYVTGRFTKKLVEPINELDLEHPLENEVYEELSPLLRRIHKQNGLIKSQVEELRTSHQEYLAITDNMKDGLIVTNKNVILSINKAAQKIYRVQAESCAGKNLLEMSRQEDLKQVWDDARNGKATEKLFEQGGRTYNLVGNPVVIDGTTEGAVILVLDVTEKEQAEKLRREFSANVSHELKTPLMSISGYAELIQNRMVKPEDIPEFAGRIRSEAGRLTSLVEDIIRLSKLDELADTAVELETVDLYNVTKDVCACLDFQAKKRNITVHLQGENAEIRGVRQVIYEMIYNLCDNAVKYNRENGTVSIQVKKDAAGILWTVTDTGIGISPEDQERIFERFYRVDKSHSRETEGTGLGLSIVKHGAMMHRAKIKVESKVGEGTTISIQF